jgi:hypothetical protein
MNLTEKCESAHTIPEECFRSASTWFLSGGTDITKVRGISLGKCFQKQVYESLDTSAHNPHIKMWGFGLFKNERVKWIVRAFASCFSMDRDYEKTDVLFVCDNNSKSCLDITNMVSHQLSNEGCRVGTIVVDNRISRQVNSTKKISWFIEFRLIDIIRAEQLALNIRFELKKHKSAIILRLGSKKLFSSILSQISQVVREVIALEKIVSLKKPKALVVTSMASRVSKATILIARRRGIPTFYIPHGAPVQKYAISPVESSSTFVWSDWFADILVAFGENRSQFCKVGNPLAKVSAASPKIKGPAERKIFFLPNPVDERLVVEAFRLFLTIVENSGMHGVIKLHPSMTDWAGLLSDLIPEKLSRTVEMSAVSLEEAGIGFGDISIVLNSTAGVDAVGLGSKILCFKFEGQFNPFNYTQYGVGKDVYVDRCCVSKVLDEFRQLQSYSENDFKGNRVRFLNSILGTSGQSSVEKISKKILLSINWDESV